MPLTFKRQTLISAFDGEKYLGKLHEKADGLYLSVTRDAEGKEVALPVTEADLVDIAHLQALRDQERDVAGRLLTKLGDLSAEAIASAASLVAEYGIEFTSEVVHEGGDSVLEDAEDTAGDPAATMIGSGELLGVTDAAADESNF